MTLRPLALPPDVPGRLWLCAMPGRHEPWTDFVREAGAAGLTRLVCLTPRHEVASHSPGYAAALDAGTLPWRWQHLTMRDFGLASDAVAFELGIAEIAAALHNGEHVAMHCAAGIGRTGTAAACVLKRLGVSRDAAVAAVDRAGSSAQSALQSGLIDRF